MVALDPPGLRNPGYLLQQAMRSTALSALDEADVIVYLADATEGTPPSLVEAAGLSSPPKAPVVTVLNKSDAIPASRRIENNEDVVSVSALTGDGIPELMARIAKQLPESPFLYPEDDISTQPVQFFVREVGAEAGRPDGDASAGAASSTRMRPSDVANA